MYLWKIPSRHLNECGLIISNEFNLLAAAPGGTACDNGCFGIIEEKPEHRGSMWFTWVLHLKNWEQHELLKKIHYYYYAHIQGRLLIASCGFCDLYVYTQKSVFVERILPDVEFMKSMLSKLCNFMKVHGN